MENKSLEVIIDQLEPEEALKQMAPLIKRLFPLLEEEKRLKFIMDMMGDSDMDKVSSMVHL